MGVHWLGATPKYAWVGKRAPKDPETVENHETSSPSGGSTKPKHFPSVAKLRFQLLFSLLYFISCFLQWKYLNELKDNVAEVNWLRDLLYTLLLPFLLFSLSVFVFRFHTRKNSKDTQETVIEVNWLRDLLPEKYPMPVSWSSIMCPDGTRTPKAKLGVPVQISSLNLSSMTVTRYEQYVLIFDLSI